MAIHPATYTNHQRLRKTVMVCLVLALFVWTIYPWLPFHGNKPPQTIVLYGFAILESVIAKNVFPAFQKKWKAQTGQDVELIGSFAGSGTVTNQLIMGAPAELAILSTELDVQRLMKAGVIRGETWKALPHQGILNRTPFVIVVRPGNPKNIRSFADLARPGIRIVHPDPLTSGAANWAIVAEYGAAVRQAGAGPDAGKSMLQGVWRNVKIQASSGRAAKTQFDNGFGDALVTYEQDALWSRGNGSPPFEIVYPRSTILSEHTVVVIESHVSHEERKLIDAFTDFLWSEEAQRIFVKNGFRSVDQRLNAVNRQFGHIHDPFLIEDFGGWQKARDLIIDKIWKNGVLKELKP
ncbi:MAG: sulfate ABC transporter substrate-binding protein [Deltaproteobacteria bacterium HGW-Deltaproteobacteria-6]|jgi:sulfate transport system substrate-binding protein|nr:MAG: sulfate ABC transporter substrate-binding protein [Deltaproteobacteria bacterium HGW-Deltaproteobacteria-6]